MKSNQFKFHRQYQSIQIQMEIPHSIDPQINPTPSKPSSQRQEQGYRWAVVGLLGCSQVLMGLASNAVIPLQHKMTQVYGVSEGKVSLSIILSFLAFSLANFPANHIIDTKGLRVSFLAGTALYTIGMTLYALINQSYYFVIAGTIFMGLGQPFLLNSPAKVAAFWFFPRNRALATAIMVGINILGVGVGFLVPTLMVHEESTGDIAKGQIQTLYLYYMVFSSICLMINYIFMRSKPESAPSQGAEANKVASPIQALKQIWNQKNMLKFFVAYCLSYGTFIAFASNCNFIIKPYGYSDMEIATNAVLLMLVGTVGAITFSIYIKKTFNFKLALRTIAFSSVVALLLLCLWLNTINLKWGTCLVISMLGFVLTPLVPVSYDLGCELAFPLGEAQVTGLLNGGALLWAFIASSLVATTIGFSSGYSSLLAMVILSIFILTGAVLFFMVKITLKRHQYQQGRSPKKVAPDSPKKIDSDDTQSSTGKDYMQSTQENISSSVDII